MRLLFKIWVLLCLLASVVSAVNAEAGVEGRVEGRVLNAISVSETADSTQVELTFTSAATEPDTIFMIAGTKPRLVMDWKATDYTVQQKHNRVAGAGLIKSVRFARRGKNDADMRIVIDLTAADVRRVPFISGNVLTLIVQDKNRVQAPIPTSVAPSAKASIPVPDVTAPRYFKDRTPYPRLKPTHQHSARQAIVKPVRKPVVVIDPGHGGYDPGALGAAGTKEKTITYAASLELKKQLEATGRYSVIITRASDVYVAHEERLRIARAKGADLFISIHADATQSGTARGASVYTLADRAINRSKRLVNTQNWIMDVDLSQQSDPVGDILVDLAQRKTATQSDEFADILIGSLSKSTKLIGNTHRRAGYFVLLAPDVPAVLLELGFISNSTDEALLNTAKHRKTLMKSVTTAINRYFDAQKP